MNRAQELLTCIDSESLGLEIGPCHNPIAPKSKGYNVRVLDCKDRKGLIQEYKDHGVNLEAIEEVDYVWSGECYRQIVGEDTVFNWIVASHVIEHSPDLIGFLNNCEEVLSPDGVLSLAIPDKRFCFDHYRPISGLASVIDKHRNKPSRHSPGTIAEYYLNVISKGGRIGWEIEHTGHIELIHNLQKTKEMYSKAASSLEYIDAHAWCFTPSSFQLLMQDLKDLGFINLSIQSVTETTGCEFFVRLSKAEVTRTLSRQELLNKVQLEMKQ